MSNPTTPFNWQMPTNTDLVTDLPADFEVFGQAVATSLADLNGGTSGQILSKASNADMDFTWIANDQGDITGITATSPLTGGGTSGAITVGIQSASTTQSGAVQLTDSTASTSTTTAATPNSVKTAYDLASTANTAAGTAQTTANAAIPKSTVTTAGDVIYATGSSTVTRLGIGSSGQILTVAGGVPTWATSSATPPGLVLVTSSTVSGSTTININNCFTSTYTNYRIVYAGTTSNTSQNIFMKLASGGTTSGTNYEFYTTRYFSSNATQVNATNNGGLGFEIAPTLQGTGFSYDVIQPQLAQSTSIFGQGGGYQSGSTRGVFAICNGIHRPQTAYDGLSIICDTSGTLTGTLYVYGYKN